MSRRVVITGIGLVTPLGIGVDENWGSLLSGKSGAGPITLFDASRCVTQFACEVKNFDPTQWIEKRLSKTLDRFIQLSLVAAELARQDAGIEVPALNSEMVGVFVGAGLGGVATLTETHRIMFEKGPQRISPYFVPAIIVNLAAGQISIRYGCKGPNMAQVSACSSGTHAVGDAFRCIERGDADVMFAGGSEAAVTEIGVGGFNAAKALSKRNADPQRASRPFDRDRDGFVIGEGSGILVLESLDHAKARRAQIYAEVVGYGLNADGFHITQPAPEGEGAQRCMRMAMRSAKIAPEDIGYINAHGTSTQMNDATETLAIKNVFGEHTKKLGVSSTKSMTGHLLGAAGGVETAYVAMALLRGILPPTINYETPDPACDLDVIPNTPREQRVTYALSNSFGFGGTNACLILRRFVD